MSKFSKATCVSRRRSSNGSSGTSSDTWASGCPDGKGIAVKLLRVAQEDKDEDWLMQFDFEGNKLSGTGTVPGEAPIYTQIFKARPEVNSIVHAHARCAS